MVFFMNTPLLGFSSMESHDSGLSTLVLLFSVLFLVSSGYTVLVVSCNTIFDCMGISSSPSGVFPVVLSGIIVESNSIVASEITLLLVAGSLIRDDFHAGSVAAGNEPALGVQVCLLALFVSITCWIAIRLTEG